MAEAARCGARFVGIGETDYPHLLRRIDSAPPLIALRGDPAIFAARRSPIVGARNASAPGLPSPSASRAGSAQAGFVIVSGLARGIDARASGDHDTRHHRGARRRASTIIRPNMRRLLEA